MSLTLGSLITALHKDAHNLDGDVVLDGYNLTLGGVVAAARGFAPVCIPNDPKLRKRVDDSVNFVNSKVSFSLFGSSVRGEGKLTRVWWF